MMNRGSRVKTVVGSNQKSLEGCDMRLLFVFFAIVSCLALADSDSNVHTATEIVTQHVLLKKDLSVAGSRLCHDGMNVYFRDQDQCREHNELMEEYGIPAVECSDQPIVPIKEMEAIHLSETNQRLYRFFVVDLYYETELRQVHPDGKSDPVVTGHHIQECNDPQRPTRFPEAVWSTRQASTNELQTLENLFTSNFQVIHAPKGEIRDMLFTEPFLWASDVSPSYAGVMIGSPLCDSEFRDSFQKAGGEITGTGRAQFDFLTLEELSDPLTSSPRNQFQNASSQSLRCNRTIEL